MSSSTSSAARALFITLVDFVSAIEMKMRFPRFAARKNLNERSK